MRRPLVLLLAGLANAGAAAAGEVVAFNATVKVTVDASGRPVAIDAPANLPEAIAAAIEKRVAGWTYVPAHRGDTPVAALTYVQVGACAVPADDGYRLGIDFKGNGPRLHSDTDRLPSPSYPRSLAMRGIGGAFVVSYAVQSDGSTRLAGIEPVGKRMKHEDRRAFEEALKDWVAALRYDPEQVDGQAVATTIRFPVQYATIDPRDLDEWRERYGAELRARAIQSEECKLASGAAADPVPLAIDSPVKVTPSPSG